MPNRNRHVLAAFALAFAASAPAAAATFTNTPTDNTIFVFGAPDTTSYGQVFVAPGGDLQSWTFSLEAADTGAFKLVVADWNGSRAVGPALYESAPVNGVVSGMADYTFAGIGLPLMTGEDYIAFLTVAGVATPLAGSGVAGSTGDGGLGGGFRFLNSAGVDPLTLSDTWSSWFIPNMTFTAQFGPSTAVPAPAGLGLLGLALLGLAAARRLRPAA